VENIPSSTTPPVRRSRLRRRFSRARDSPLSCHSASPLPSTTCGERNKNAARLSVEGSSCRSLGVRRAFQCLPGITVARIQIELLSGGATSAFYPSQQRVEDTDEESTGNRDLGRRARLGVCDGAVDARPDEAAAAEAEDDESEDDVPEACGPEDGGHDRNAGARRS